MTRAPLVKPYGAGLKIGIGPARFFAEGRYASVKTAGGATKFLPVIVGVTFGSK